MYILKYTKIAVPENLDGDYFDGYLGAEWSPPVQYTKGLWDYLDRMANNILTDPTNPESPLNTSGTHIVDVYKTKVEENDIEGYLEDKLIASPTSGLSITKSGASNKQLNFAMNIGETTPAQLSYSLLHTPTTIKKLVAGDNMIIEDNEDSLLLSTDSKSWEIDYNDKISEGAHIVVAEFEFDTAQIRANFTPESGDPNLLNYSFALQCDNQFAVATNGSTSTIHLSGTIAVDASGNVYINTNYRNFTVDKMVIKEVFTHHRTSSPYSGNDNIIIQICMNDEYINTDPSALLNNGVTSFSLINSTFPSVFTFTKGEGQDSTIPLELLIPLEAVGVQYDTDNDRFYFLKDVLINGDANGNTEILNVNRMTFSGDEGINIATSSGSNKTSIAIGFESDASNATISTNYSTAIGRQAKATGYNATAIGSLSEATGEANGSTAIGNNSRASSYNSVALGVGCNSSSRASISIGNYCETTGEHSVSIGDLSKSHKDNSVVVGRCAQIGSNSDLIFGFGVSTNLPTNTTDDFNILFGIKDNGDVDTKGHKITNGAEGTDPTDFVILSQLTAGLSGKEDTFTKNSAFNKNFGTVAGTVSEGNHTHTFASLTSKPTTISGYGITDAYTKTYINANFQPLENQRVSTTNNVTFASVTTTGNIYANTSELVLTENIVADLDMNNHAISGVTDIAVSGGIATGGNGEYLKTKSYTGTLGAGATGTIHISGITNTNFRGFSMWIQSTGDNWTLNEGDSYIALLNATNNAIYLSNIVPTLQGRSYRVLIYYV